MKRIDANRILVPAEGAMKVDAVIYASDRIRLEEDAVRQLRDAASLPSVDRAIATPDIHLGYGVPIGCVVGLRDIVVPAAVGYDVNCGMRIVTTPVRRGEIDPVEVAQSFRRDVPLGEGKTNLRLSRDALDVVLARGVKGLDEIAGSTGRIWESRDPVEEADDIRRIEDEGSLPGKPSALSDRARERGLAQLGTLGGGNHFIEVQAVDRVEDAKLARLWGIEKDAICVMIHSGSRGLGHQVGGDYMKLATRCTGDRSPTSHLAWLDADSPEGQDYVGAMFAAANFAFVNRQIMTVLVRRDLRHILGDVPLPIIYDVPHNMAKRETHDGVKLWVHRKGATRAFPPERMQGTPFAEVGQPVLIPGSMGTASYVLVGTPGAKATYYSVNHGAGRTMSRSEAGGGKRRWGKRPKKGARPAAISDEDFERAMRGIHLIAENRWSVKEEAPQAYKDIDEVVRVVVDAGLARIVARMVPLAVLKG
ncbi:MAG TPA: RtcB family protein [Planctomycetota bacterium]|nr:RtcB family protein [Planctomycetota bacterium]